MITYKGLGWLSIVFVFAPVLLIFIPGELLLGLSAEYRGLPAGISIIVGSVINWFIGRKLNKISTEHFVAGMKMQNASFLWGVLGIVLIIMNLLQLFLSKYRVIG
ncbi:MAG: hypothetical protein KBA53_00575 [Thermoclostridium sp.]|nr:hypothetical protein [Thermoclostridium sp.]